MHLYSCPRLAKSLQYAMALASFALAVVSTDAATLSLATVPLFAGGSIPPLVMIDMSKDHTLHQKAYNDYTDLDGSGALDVPGETTYNNNTEYFGYFDYSKCYKYDTTLNRFTPLGNAAGHYCDGYTSAWSGNFLNWSSMSRVDEVRKILYGGNRVVDTVDPTAKLATTVLERAYLPMDAHAWAKYYGGTDIPKLTPFTSTDVQGDTATGSGTSTATLKMQTTYYKNVPVSNLANLAVGDQLQFTATATPQPSMTGWVAAINGSKIDIAFYQDSVTDASQVGKPFSKWNIKNLTLGGLTLCNVTPADSTDLSQTNTQAPEIRVVKGNYATWGASEKWQCKWADGSEKYTNGQSTFITHIPTTNLDNSKDTDSAVYGSSNGNRAAISGTSSSSENPAQATRGLGAGSAVGTYYARVQACVANMLGNETCTQYGNYYKPTGLLQKYGESGQMLFGLMTGSYDKNISGGVLRQNVTNFSQEVDKATGIFQSTTTGIVWNINRLRPYGYKYSDGGYMSADNCNYQQTGIVLGAGGGNLQGAAAGEGNCSTWGNPMSEIYLETLRYFAGKSPDSRDSPSGGKWAKDAALKLTTVTWRDPFKGDSSNPAVPYCSPLNTLVFNASVSSYDNDQLDLFSDIKTGASVSTYTDLVGVGEGINNNKWFMGENATLSDKLCSGKQISKFSEVLGICPEGPSQKGTFQIAGAAYYAKTNRIRSATTVPSTVPSTDTTSLKVSTYGVQLATTTPRISVNVAGKTVNIVPAYMLTSPSGVNSSGTLVDFKVIAKTANSGQFYINWEDSVAGGDYDQDVWGILSYDVSGSTLSISTQVVAASTANGQGFGYVVSGTSKDGPHFHSGIYSFNYQDPAPITVTPSAKVNSTGGCSNCGAGDVKTTATYAVVGNAASQLNDPLLYAAKWGGFKDTNDSNTPDVAGEWDATLADGSNGSDGVPDNYFYASNPSALNASLERAFISILQTSSSSSVATNSTSLNNGAVVYQARFNGTDWSGQLLAYKVSDTGAISGSSSWEAGDLLNKLGAANRTILTYDAAAGAGVPFQWASLPTAFKSALNGSDGKGSDRLDWMRGVKTSEGAAAGKFRVRGKSILGDIVNSNPQYVGAPNGDWADADYLDFYTKYKTRTPMLYVGANDGMLHAFSAGTGPSGKDDSGAERFAYVPSMLMSRLPTLTNLGYVHGYFVDGTPIIADAKIDGSRWASVLVGSLGAGAAGIFALDVTNPDAVSEADAASKVLWEFTADVDPDLGYTFGRPSIVRLHNGRWAAVFGNGYNSTAINSKADGKAYLYVVFLDHQSAKNVWKLGTDYLKIPTGAGSTTTPNGLSQVFAADIDLAVDGVTDVIYAGDLLGNLWKFDMRSTSQAAWGVGSAAKPLFQAIGSDAKTVQPITAPLQVLRNGIAGYVVTFGTGRYIATDDPTNLAVQSFYGIWDPDNTPTPTTTTLRSLLVEQTIDSEVATASVTSRVTSANAVTYSSGGKQGWFIDLVSPPDKTALGERVIYAPIILGTTVIFPTLVPSSNSCDNGGYSWLMVMSAISGSHLANPPIDTNGDGAFTDADKAKDSKGNLVATAGLRSTIGIITTPTLIRSKTTNNTGSSIGIGSGGGDGASIGGGSSTPIIALSSGTSGAIGSQNLSGNNAYGRISWREIQK
jgi:type IV pilus assembly protein PilY1